MRVIDPHMHLTGPSVWPALWVLIGLWLSACASSPPPAPIPVTLQSQIADERVIELPVTLGASNLLVVSGQLPNGEAASFVIDTGATLSSIYRATQKRLQLSTQSQMPIRVHGMISTAMQPVTTLPGLSLGGTQLGPLRVAVIDPQKADKASAVSTHSEPASDGIIGMDVLQNYHLYYNPEQAKIRLIPHAVGVPAVPKMWKRITLSQNPFLEDGRALHFFNLRIGFSITPALLDTGSEINLMNWDTERFPQLRDLRKSMRRDWEIQGALGRFKPVSRILAKRTSAGNRRWHQSEFVVLDFESLDVLGIEDNPFVIVGMPMLGDRAMVLDFQNDRAYFSPSMQEELDQEKANAQPALKDNNPDRP